MITEDELATLPERSQRYLDYVVTVQDAQSFGFCVVGQRRVWRNAEDWCGVTFEQFIKEGAKIRWLLETGHPFAAALVNNVVKRFEHGIE